MSGSFLGEIGGTENGHGTEAKETPLPPHLQAPTPK